jgi:two-component system NarL family sensor kinase
VARELHDSVNQILSSVAFRVESVTAQIPPESKSLKQEIAKVRLLLQKAIHEVRGISENLRPSELDELGLIAALRALCEDFVERTQVVVKLEAPAEQVRFSSDIELTLYRIVQEALTNVEKHAEATNVKLALNWDEWFLTLCIRDDGRGLASYRPTTNEHKRLGMGLIDMKERCAFLGGGFSIHSDTGGGTEIAVRIPRQAVLRNGAT